MSSSPAPLTKRRREVMVVVSLSSRRRPPVENVDAVDHVFEVAHLVSRDDDALLLGHAEAMTLRNWLFEGMSMPLVGSSMSSSGVLVARGKTHQIFLFLPHRSLGQILDRLQLEIGQVSVELLAVEMRIEHTVAAHIGIDRDSGQVELLGHEKNLFECLGATTSHLHTVERDVSLVGKHQSAHHIEQGRLAYAVLAQQAVDRPRVYRQVDALEYGSLLFVIAKYKDCQSVTLLFRIRVVYLLWCISLIVHYKCR